MHSALRLVSSLSWLTAGLWFATGAAAAEPPAPAAPAPGATSGTPASAPTDAGSPAVDASAPTTPADAAPSAPPETIYVHGRHDGPSRGAGDHSIDIGQLARVPRTDAAQLLKMAPGFYLANQGGGTGHPYQIFLRGFDAREGQDIEFTVEGVPINEVGNVHGNGLADTHFIIPELVESLRVLEGPFAPQQGNFAVAGSARYNLGLSQRGFTLQGATGSYGNRRALLLWGPGGASTHTFAGVEYARGDGFGQNRNYERMTAMGSYEGRLGKTGSWRLLATSYATHYNSAGVLRVDDMKAGKVDFYGTYDPQQGGDSSRHSVALLIDDTFGRTQLQETVYVTRRDFRLRENLTGYLLDPQLDTQSVRQNAQRGDLIDQRSGILTLGSKGSARSRWKALGQRQEIELGYSGRLDEVDSTQQRNRFGTTIPYRTNLDIQSSLANLGLYADASFKPLSWVTLRGGVRVDLYSYRVKNRCAQSVKPTNSFQTFEPDTECFDGDRNGYRSPDETSSTAASIWQPRATLLIGPFTGFTFSLSHGVGSRSLDPQYVAQNYDTPFARVTSTEGGVAYAHSFEDFSLSARSVFFQTHVDRDLFFNATEGRNTLANGTTRTGWAGNARATGDFFDIAGNLTLVRGTFDDTHLLIPYVPDLVARADGTLFGDIPWKPLGQTLHGAVAVGFSYVGERALPYDERSQVIAVTDASASLGWRMVTLTLACTNLFDRRYRQAEYNYTSDFRKLNDYATQVATRHFTAGEPRMITATLSLHLDPDG